MIGAIQTALSGLFAATKRVEAGAHNIANMHTNGAAAQTVRQTAQDGGVRAEIVQKNPPFTPTYHPGSPFADAQGMVQAPNVDLAEEAVNMTLAETAYKANIKVMQAAQDMQDEALNILDRRV